MPPVPGALRSLRPLAFLPLVACAGAPGDRGDGLANGADEGALATGSLEGTLLVSDDPAAKVEVSFGVAADKTPIAKVVRAGKSRTLKCSSFINLEERDFTPEQVGITCTEDLRAGYDWCEVTVERKGANTFEMDASCDNSSNPNAMVASMQKTYAILSGEAAPAESNRARKGGILLTEARHATDPFADAIAFTEALLPALREVLTKKATISAFRTRQIEEHEVTRIAAHPNFAERATQAVVFANAYSAHADKIIVEGAPNAFASPSEIVSRVLSTARCVEGPRDQPFCLH
ncbi:MAG: hypothetical protein IPG50_23305 [Myxococcales bacterium]|nr:hypothetical protein [Myxococcales bacterium]